MGVNQSWVGLVYSEGGGVWSPRHLFRIYEMEIYRQARPGEQT